MEITVGKFTLTQAHIDLLLEELADEKVKTAAELQQYLKNYSYLADNSRKCHLLLSPKKKGRNFAIPY